MVPIIFELYIFTYHLFTCMQKILIILFTLFQIQFGIGQIQTGIWRAELETPGGPLPFNFELTEKNNQYFFEMHNADEKLATNEVRITENKIQIQLAVFHSTIEAEISESGKKLTGKFQDFSRGDNYTIPFSATAGESYRFFKMHENAQTDISGNWATQFYYGADSSFAIGVFEQKGNKLKGTFLTTTGDYRFLDGDVSGNQFYLSAFDGSHAYLFTGEIILDSLLQGKFFSGNHWQETFIAQRNDTITLPDAESLTYLKEGYEQFSFCFPDAEGKIVCDTDPQFQNKVLIIQLMGTWCPNCMDETAYLAEIYQKYNPLGVEIIALAFERETTLEMAAKNFERLRNRFGITYPLLLAGSNKKAEAAKVLPMLNAVIAFPTLIIINRLGQVEFIHTGYNGPATGRLYDDFTRDFEKKLDQLIK